MNSNIKDDSLLATLVFETYSSVDETKESSSDLSAYFDSRTSSSHEGSNSDHFLEDKLLRSNVSFGCMSYFDSTSSFHFNLKSENYTCPRNWGDFAKIYQSMNESDYQLIESFSDELLMNEIFKSKVDYEYEAISFCGRGESYIIFMPKGSDEILNWLKKYCESGQKAA